MTSKYKDPEWLREKYVNCGLSFSDIADLCTCSDTTVEYWINKYDIETRDPWETRDVNCEGLHREESWLREMYIDEGFTAEELADRCGCTNETILDWLRGYDISVRSFSDQVLTCERKHESEDWIRQTYFVEDNTIDEVANLCGCSDSVIKRMFNEFGIEIKKGYNCSGRHRDVDWLRVKYNEEEMTTVQMAERCGCSQNSICKWMEKFNIERDDGTFQEGEDHWNYVNGQSTRENLDFRKSNRWKEFSRSRKEEVDWRCEYCGGGSRLHTHHIYPVSMGGSIWDNEFAVLCRQCHIGDYSRWHPEQLREYIDG